MNTARWAGVAGVLFVVLFVLGFLTAGDVPGGDEDSDDEVVRYYEDSGNQSMLITVAYMLIASGLAFVAFSGLGLYSPMRAAEDTVARHSANLGIAASILTAAAISAGGIAFATVAAGVSFQDDPVDAGVARFLVHFGYGSILVWGGLASAASIAAFSLAGQRLALVPQWLAWLGYLAAVVLLFAIVYLPMIALPIWVLVASIRLLVQRAEIPARSGQALAI
jgi:hypothetical protein